MKNVINLKLFVSCCVAFLFLIKKCAVWPYASFGNVFDYSVIRCEIIMWKSIAVFLVTVVVTYMKYIIPFQQIRNVHFLYYSWPWIFGYFIETYCSWHVHSSLSIFTYCWFRDFSQQTIHMMYPNYHCVDNLIIAW